MSDIIQKKLMYENLLKKQMCDAYEIEYFKHKISDKKFKKWLKTRTRNTIFWFYRLHAFIPTIFRI